MISLEGVTHLVGSTQHEVEVASSYCSLYFPWPKLKQQIKEGGNICLENNQIRVFKTK